MIKCDTNEGYLCGEVIYKDACAVKNGPCLTLPYLLSI
jgi:hypothetical protein